MALPVFFQTTEEIIDSVNKNLPVVKLSSSGKSAFGGSAIKNYLLPENAGGMTSVASHVGADNSRVFNTKTGVLAKMTLLFNAHGSYVTPNFGQAVTATNQPFNFAGIALTSSQIVSDNWNQKLFAAGVLPPPRDLFGMSHFEFNQKVILFGGENNGSILNDTWAWDGTTWVQLNPLVSPGARKNFSMTYDSTRKVVVLYGGLDVSNNVLNDTWEFNGTNWAQVVTAHSPGPRSDYAMKYDSNRGKTVLFGGRNITILYNDTWEYNGTDWTQVVTGVSPNIRFQHATAFDSSRNKTILFSGIGVAATTTTVSSSVVPADTIVNVASTASFPTSGTIIIDTEYISYTGVTPTSFTGCTRGLFNTAAAAHSPAATVRGLIAYGDTWEYDGINWVQIFLAGVQPSPRAGSKLIYNSTKKISIMFAGIGNPGSNTNDLNDTWQYDGSSWTQINIFGPSPREYFGMTYDSNRDKIVLFGGENTALIGANGETWEFGSPLRPVVVQTSGDGFVYFDATAGRPTPVIGDFLGPSSVNGTVTPIYDGYSPVFGVAMEPPVPLNTTLSANITSFDTIIAVASTIGFPTSGTIKIDAEQITYTGVTSTTFTGCTRGANSTTPANHVANTMVFSTVPLQLTVNGSTVGVVKMRIRPFYGFIPPQPPSITNFSPNAAIVGATVTLTGTVFIGTTQLTINSAFPANATFNVISNNQITFIVPAGAQQGTITVTNAQGNSTSVNNFTTLPIITSVSAVANSVGSAVTIYGHTFTYATLVQFNGISSPFSITNDTQITTTIPAGGTTGTLSVTITYPSTNTEVATFPNFNVVAPPTISNVAPLAGPIGAASFTTLSGGITAVSTTPITVVSTVGFLAPGFIIIDSEQISYTNIVGNTFAGTITRGYNGTTAASHTNGTPVNYGNVNPAGYVSVSGSGFNVHGPSYDGYGLVQFVDVATQTQILNATRTVFNDTTIGLVVPNPGVAQPTTAYYVRITTAGGIVTSSQQFTIIPVPKFLGVGPTFISQAGGASGVAGDMVRIFGDYGFTGVSKVMFDGYASPSVHFVNDGYITAIVPTVASSTDITGPISVTSTGGTKSTSDAPATAPINFTILQQPSITSFSPISGKTGDIISIIGTNLTSVSSVKFESMLYSATFSIVNDGRINVVVPASSTGIAFSPITAHIIIAKGPFIVTSSGTFTYYPPPMSLTVSNPAPDGGGINGGVGTVVTLTGNNLTQGGTLVTFGAQPATVNSAAPSSVNVTVPSNAGNGIVLTTAGGSASVGFSVLQPVAISSFYTDWPYDHHAATPYYPSQIDVYGANFRNSPFMQVYVIDPAQGYASQFVPFTFYDSTHIRFDASTLGSFVGDTCYIQVITYYPGAQYSSNVYGLSIFYPIT